MKKYYLAVDIGASSGRHILCSLGENGLLELEEVYRFKNGLVKKDGELCWDLESLFSNIKAGLKKCGEIGKIPVSMGVDTWGVDFVLLDKEDKIIGNTVGYRDSRTNGMDEVVYQTISAEELYARTGIQKQLYNTIYQLVAVKEKHPEYLERAKTFLTVPDYFHFMLSGVKTNEYTEASTTQLLSPVSKDWDFELIEMLGLPTDIFQKVSVPGTVLGGLRPEVRDEVGFDVKVVLPASHDTGSAVAAVPSNADDYVYISSGTWSLIGIERMQADCSAKARKANFANEGGYNYRFRFLKNIMGLWMIQSLKKEYNDKYSFDDLCNAAMEVSDFPTRVDTEDYCFLAPDSMIAALQDYSRRTGQPVPETPGQLALVVYASLAESYARAVEELEDITGRKFNKIHVVGGGSKDTYLCELTSKATGRPVYAGPTEATAVGNLTVQMLADGVFTDLPQAREIIFKSFGVKEY
ncbi:MAG: rhamnulokinase [Clostridia bacterium]|nr:rhamnulokinase [Clostridia bacterium]